MRPLLRALFDILGTNYKPDKLSAVIAVFYLISILTFATRILR